MNQMVSFVLLSLISFLLVLSGGIAYQKIEKGFIGTFVGYTVGGIIVFLALYFSSSLGCPYALSFSAIIVGSALGMVCLKVRGCL